MLNLPPAYAFSASGLQDFVECARRFQLRHLLGQDWPAPTAEPMGNAEQAIELGRRFHLLIERFYKGVPTPPPTEGDLARWWEAFRQHPPRNLPKTHRHTEFTAAAWLAGQPFIAKYDLLAYEPNGDVVIVDWKTVKPTPRHMLERRLQTILYPLLLVKAAPAALGWQVQPEQVKLVYWFAEGEQGAPIEEHFEYSSARYNNDERFIEALIQRLQSIEAAIFPLTTNERACRLCQYRSLCDRGRVAGALNEDIEDVYPDVDELRNLINDGSEELVL
jgi:hypothetical protein